MKDRLFSKSASEVVGLLRRGEVSPLELIDEVEARAGAVEPDINALPTLCLDRAREHARQLMRDNPEPTKRGW